MPNGKPGDHPYTDVVLHGRDVYSKRADELVREIASLVGDRERRALADMLFLQYNEFEKPDVERLERVLIEMRDKARSDARARGYEA